MKLNQALPFIFCWVSCLLLFVLPLDAGFPRTKEDFPNQMMICSFGGKDQGILWPGGEAVALQAGLIKTCGKQWK